MFEQAGIADILSHLGWFSFRGGAMVRIWGAAVGVISEVGAVLEITVVSVVVVSGSKLLGSVTFSGGQYTNIFVAFSGL